MNNLQIPNLKTERLILRGPKAEDSENVAAFFGDKERSWGFGGRLNRNDAWRLFASMIGHWLLNGHRYWTGESLDKQPEGIVGIWGPEGWPEPELGWVMAAGNEGRGHARDAAEEMRGYTYNTLGFETFNSNIFPGNDRSIGLAEWQGGHYERSFENVSHGPEPIYRRPGPDHVVGAIQ